MSSHVLVVFEKLPDRSKMQPQERRMLLDSDIREAMARAARRIDNQAQQYRVTGYSWDLNDIVYDLARVAPEQEAPIPGQVIGNAAVPTVIATLKIERP